MVGVRRAKSVNSVNSAAVLHDSSVAELSLFSAVIPRGGCRYSFSERCNTYIQQKNLYHDSALWFLVCFT